MSKLRQSIARRFIARIERQGIGEVAPRKITIAGLQFEARQICVGGGVCPFDFQRRVEGVSRLFSLACTGERCAK